MNITNKSEYTIYGYIKEILALIDNPIIFEFGVHWAEDTKRIMQLCKNKPLYYGFEPDGRNLRIIIDRERQKLPYELKLIDCAIGAIDGEAILYRSEGVHEPSGNPMTGASSIKYPKEVKNKFKWFDFKGKETVDVYCLDTFCQKNKVDRIDFIWADTQGNEYDMLLGAEKMLKKTKFLYLEYSNIELYEGQRPLKDILSLLKGWRVIHDFKTDVLLQNDNFK